MGCGGSKAPELDDGAGFSNLNAWSAPGSAEDGEGARRGSIAHKAPEYESGAVQHVMADFDPKKIGVLTRHGIAPARTGGGGSKAKINQDRGLVCWPFNGSHNQALLCVFDGHGVQGERISEWCATEIGVRLENDRELLASDPKKSLIKTVVAMDKQLLSDPVLGSCARGAGTTSNVIYMKGSKVYVACSGDSRAVLGRYKGDKIQGIDLSHDHKPDKPEEKARITKAGGVVTAPGPNGLPPSRVWVNGRVGLAMSRSIGDGEAKGHGVIPDPEVTEMEVQLGADGSKTGDAFVIVASDGIWEFISSQQACEVVAKYDLAIKGCEQLVKLAEQKWKEEEGSYRDDITCIVAKLPFLEDRGEDGLPLEIATGQKASGGDAPAMAANDSFKVSRPDDDDDDDKDEGKEGFVARRLSVALPSDLSESQLGA